MTPILGFLLFFLMFLLNSLCIQLILDTIVKFGIIYADDTTLMLTMNDKLHITTRENKAACNKWGVKINISKYMVITSPVKHVILTNEELDNIVPSTKRDEN